jgi:hypothetical protein
MLLLLVVFFFFATADPSLVAIIVALIAPIGAYLLAARKMSGKINTSEATDLWAESKAIRDWSAERLKACDEEIAALRTALSSALSRIDALEKENNRLKESP